jgi:glycosyltransferase involved in cell wall biosynthesis
MTRDQEEKGLSRADVVIAIQNQDRLFLEKMAPGKVITVGHSVALEDPCKWRPDRCNLLYLGSSNASNYQSILSFIQEVLPPLRNRIPHLKLVVAGKISKRIEDHEAIIKLDEVDDVRRAYEAADIVINPVQFGTGLKIKSIEAMGQGKPLVTTSIGAEGMEDGAGLAFLVANDVSEFVLAIERLCSDENYFNAVAQQAFAFSRLWNRSTVSELASLLRD